MAEAKKSERNTFVNWKLVSNIEYMINYDNYDFTAIVVLKYGKNKN